MEKFIVPIEDYKRWSRETLIKAIKEAEKENGSLFWKQLYLWNLGEALRMVEKNSWTKRK